MELFEEYLPTKSEKKELISYLKSRGNDLFDLIKKADEKREDLVGNVVTFVRNQNLNFTNICYQKCLFCSFSKAENESGAYRFSLEEIKQKVLISKKNKVTEICATGGIDPKLGFDYYLSLIKTIKKFYSEVHVHAFSPFEIHVLAKREGSSVEDILRELVSAGLGSLAGTAAEILVDRVRKIICPNKLSTSEWINVITTAHELGIKTTSTIMYGHVETLEDIATHLSIIKKIQEQTRGFTEFIPLPFIHYNTPLYHSGISRAGSTGIEDMVLLASSRLFFDDLIPNIQVSWVKTGTKFSQLGLYSGANDFGGTLFEENISRSAGSTYGTHLEEKEIIRIITDAGRIPARRTTLYEIIEKF